jgi:hypothetical protein
MSELVDVIFAVAHSQYIYKLQLVSIELLNIR